MTDQQHYERVQRFAHFAHLCPDVMLRGTDDPRVSIREPMRGIFVWSWCAAGVRLWREADAFAPYGWPLATSERS